MIEDMMRMYYADIGALVDHLGPEEFIKLWRRYHKTSFDEVCGFSDLFKKERELPALLKK